MNIKIHVLIPTRERSKTLFWTIKSCLNQEYENYDIIVSDNCSTDDTAEVVKNFCDPRIRYFKTPKRLSMSHNWEFALSKVDDGYVILIGDDDALMPNALSKIAKIVEDKNVDAMIWTLHGYNWPDHPSPAYRNILTILLNYHYFRVDSFDKLQEVSKEFNYTELPLIYHGVVNYKIIEQFKSKHKIFFHSMIPDQFSGVIIAGEVDHYLISKYPFSIAGHSSLSSGCSYGYASTEEDKKAINMFLNEDNPDFHPKMIIAPCSATNVSEAFLQARKLNPKIPKIDLKNMLKKAFLECSNNSINKKQFVESIDIFEKIAGLNNLSKLFGELKDKYLNRHIFLPKQGLTLGYNESFNKLTIKMENRNLTNVYDASLFIDQFVKEMPVKRNYNPLGEPIHIHFLNGFRHLIHKFLQLLNK